MNLSILLYYYRRVGFGFVFKLLKRRIFKISGIPQLSSIFISPSHECNANCVHCYEKFPGKKPASLTTAQIKDILDQFKSLGGFLAQFCSGEVLLRDDITELIKYSSDKKMLSSITTNGILLDEKKLDELIDAGLNKLVVSIDHANPKEHDKLRRVDGCFEKATNALKMAHKKGIFTEIWTYVAHSNSNVLDDIIELGKELHVSNVFVFFPLLSGHLFDKPEENLTFEEREKYRKKYNNIKGVQLEFPTEESICRGGGETHICVMPTGEVTFCPSVPYSYGNIKDRTLKDCLKDIVDDYNKFCKSDCTGECIVNFPEYRENNKGKFIY